MRASIRHLAWVCVLLCGNASGQTATYTIKPGDSLSKIARSQGCTVEALAKANGIKLSAIIQAGQTLKLPVTTSATASDGSHVIQPGDTFSSISRKYGMSVESLLAANPGLNPKTLKPGQKIRLAAAATPLAGESRTSRDPAAAPTPAASSPAAATSQEVPTETPDATPPPSRQETIRTVMVEEEMTFGEFAAKHGIDIQRLNELNGLDLTSATVLAKGSELYVPSQP